MTHSENETEALGERLAGALFPNALITLQGELGAGKTALARGIARGMGIEGVCSPTFTIVQEYAGRLPLYHFDAYRLGSGEELLEMGFSEYLDAGGVVLLEWPEHVQDALPVSRLEISLQGSGLQPRAIQLRALQECYLPLLRAVKGEKVC